MGTDNPFISGVGFGDWFKNLWKDSIPQDVQGVVPEPVLVPVKKRKKKAKKKAVKR